MSTSTTLEPQGTSLLPSSTVGSSPKPKQESCALRSMSTPPSLMKTPSSLLLPQKNWSESRYNSQMLRRLQCPHAHSHRWCDSCQTLTGWEPPQPIRQKQRSLIPSFGQLQKAVKMPYWFPFGYQIKQQAIMKKVCSEWREEQFMKAIVKQSTHIAAQEALHCQVHQQHRGHGATPQA